ncbi:ankyrin repeat domain-containing protein [Blastococcus saxobsidens]|uniref:Ankyrin repeat-containing protein n=1 Tax=Blastococcus saxobsidens (strain DD2) TaxID=1146883 RepID=H6RJ64_BLASD|nr:ankyrin repeat domain-containing protein [Blastococcus saxobsidens]CCG04809.1 Ankyrin repeat-containing protein [Blastococcus saxobsidens DD2]
MTTRMTVQRLDRMIAEEHADDVRAAVAEAPHLLTASVERQGEGGWTPLHLAVACDRADVVPVLVEAGADLAARTDGHRTPLHVALEHAPGLVPMLVELGAVVDAPSAAYLDDVDRLTAELDGGAPLTDPTTGLDLLAWAAYGGAARAARLLIDRGADPDGGALHAAAEGRRLELVRLLLDAGAEVDRRDPDTGRTPLHTAVAAGGTGASPEIVRLLLDAGADVDATTHDGASALDISRVAAARHRRADEGEASGADALADLLVARGASH